MRAPPRQARGPAIMHLMTVVLLCASLSCLADARASPTKKAFLQNELPLGLVVTTPVELSLNDSSTVTMEGRQAITAVFSRPVIALGSDFGQPAAAQKAPFRLSCPVPGRLRWVTTTTARFDTDVDWPSDLDCSLDWNTGMTSYDGVPLQLGDVPAARRLTGAALTMSITDVTSARALNVTDNLWSAQANYDTPEVPPDGRILTSFSYPVHLQMLQATLQLLEGAKGEGPAVKFDIYPCQSPAPWIYPKGWLATTSSGSSSSSSPADLSLDVNSTCAEVVPRTQLQPATTYVLRLPAGSRYHALAGPLRQQLDSAVTGLRPFQLPFQTDLARSDAYGTSYRRLDLWLPHGLSPDTPPQALAQRISLCELQSKSLPCTATSFNLSMLSRAKARLSVPSLKPDTQYRISVAADPAVKDGFGQGLQASDLTFWTSPIQYTFSPPVTRDLVAVLEAGAENLAAWPVVTRSPVQSSRLPYFGGGQAVPRALQAWDLDLRAAGVQASVAKLVAQGYFYDYNLTKVFGAPATSVEVPATLRAPTKSLMAQWQQLSLPLQGGAAGHGARLVSYCCTEQGNNAYAKLLLNTSLSFSVVKAGQSFTAWVLDGAVGGGPLADAAVSLFYVPNPNADSGYYTYPDPELLASCKTNADGLCTMNATKETYRNLIAFAVAGDRVAMLGNAGFLSAPSLPSAFVGSLVADRRVIVPGDSLKITGFVQQVSASGLQLPAASYAALSISPPWDATATPDRIFPGGMGIAVRPVRGLRQGAASTSGGRRLTQMAVAGSAAMSSVAVAPLIIQDTSVAVPGAADTQVVIVKLDGTSGTVHGEIPIPKDARLQSYTVQLSLPAPGDASGNPNGPAPDSSIASGWLPVSDGAFSFTVADPRPPTAELKMETTPWTEPNGTISVNLTAVSYLGASVAASPLTLTWRHSRASGVLNLTTDGAGRVETTIDLGALPGANQTTLYDNVAINVEWIGPTRERITKDATVILADGPARLDVSLSLTTDLVGTSFAVAATLTSNTDAGTPLTGLPVTATLRPAPSNDTAAGVLCTVAAPPSCSLTSGEPFTSACQLALPCVGHFQLEACADVPLSSGAGAPTRRVCTTQTRGLNASEWADRPLSSHPGPTLTTDKSSYAMGDSATLLFQSPWPAARLLLTWGNSFKTKSKVVQALPSGGLAQVTIGPLGDECLGGCSVLAVLAVPRLGADQVAAPAQVPVSHLFDPRSPHTHSMSAVLEVRPDNQLGVKVAVAAAEGAVATNITDADGETVLAIEPGAEAEVTVSVTSSGAADAPAAESVEVTVYGVDKAFLDLMPYDLPHPEQQVLLRLAADLQAFDMDQYRVAPGSVQAVFNKLMARLTGQDPWLPVDTSVIPGNGAVDANDTAYAAGYSTSLTYMPGGYYYAESVNMASDAVMVAAAVGGAVAPMATAAAALPLATANKALSRGEAAGSSAASSASSSSSGGLTVRKQGDFVVTPLFTTATTGADGRATVTFKAPQNLGTFVIRAFAASGPSARYGSGETKVAARRAVSLTPSVPRFVRVGDTFEAGAVVTAGSAPATISVTLVLQGASDSPVTLMGTSSKVLTFTADGDLQKEVRFSFAAAAMGTAVLTLIAAEDQDGGAGGRDSVQLNLTVEGQQSDVWVATTFALAANGTATQWQEGMALPAAVPGSGGLALTAGVGYFPAIAAVYDNLLQEGKDRTYPLAQPSLLWATLPAVLSYYNQPLNSSQAAAVADGFTALAKLTSPNVGLQWTDPTRWGSWTPDRTDLYLNTWALFLAQEHGAAGLTASSPSWTDLSGTQLPQWRQAVETQVVRDAEEARTRAWAPGPYSDWSTLAWVRLVLGAEWVPSNASPQVQQDLSLGALLAANASLSRENRVVLSLALQPLGAANPAPKLVAAVVAEVTSALRVQGRTAYVAAAPGTSSAASLGEQALALLLLLRSGATHPLVPKLAAYVANPVRPTGGVYGTFTVRPSWSEQGLAVAALSEYDRARGSSRPDLELVADAGGLTVLEASFHPGGSFLPVTNTTAWEDIPPGPNGSSSNLSFEASGTGEVTVSASLHFVPAAPLPYPTYRGLLVESAVRLVDPATGRPTGRALSAVPLGSVVALTLQLTSPDDLGAVTLQVLMPGGLEPLDPNVAQGVVSGCGADWVDGPSWRVVLRGWWWPMCPAQETRPSVVTFSFLALRAGTSSVTVTAVAATPGTFLMPPVKAFADQQPELMGMTAAGSFTVCADCSGPTYVAAPPPLTACPNACSGHGLCNLKTGRCSCDTGYSRTDCSRPVA